MLDSERCARKKETALEKKKGKSTIILLTLILFFQCINSTYKTFPSIPFILKLIIRSNIWNAERTAHHFRKGGEIDSRDIDQGE